MVAVASSKEEVLEVLKRDIYAENGVWDFSKVCVARGEKRREERTSGLM